MIETFYDLFKEYPGYTIAAIIILILILMAVSIQIITELVKFIAKKSNKKYTNVVINTSLRYKDVLCINNRYDFYDLKNKYIYHKYHKSKVQFDRFDYTKFLEEEIEKDIDFFKWIQKAVVENNRLIKQYKMELMNISPFVDGDTFDIKGVSFSKYRKMEERIVANKILYPVLEPQIVIVSSYISPKGRNSYNDNRIFSYSELVKEYNIVCENLKKKETKEYQRKIMTDSLRYDIMKRDGFKCVLCGRNADDGVKLHVDHIIPVSKGGKTVPSNLRTLCDSCNLGKRDKYDKYGAN